MTFPTRNSNTALIQMAIDRISRLDDNEFNKLINLAIIHLQQEDSIEEQNVNEMIMILHQLRDNPEELKNYIVHSDDSTTSDCFTLGGTYCPTLCFEKLICASGLIIVWITFLTADFLLGLFVTLITDCF